MMKKIIAIFILACFCILSNSFVIAKEQENTSIKIVKENFQYGLIEKTSKQQILPIKYKKIRKVKYDKKKVIIAENDNYITLYSPDGLYDDFLKSYYQANKYNSNIKFVNYPNHAVIVYEQNKKFGLIAFENGILTITKPVYEKVTYPDENSAVSKLLNISFAPYKGIIAYTGYMKGKCSFLTLEDIFNNNPVKLSNNPLILSQTEIKEDLSLSNGNLISEYKGAEYTKNSFITSEIKDIYFQTPVINSSDLYSVINNNSRLKVKNYPQKFMLKAGLHLYIYNSDIISEIILPVSDFYLPDSLLKTLTGIDISFQNPDSIIAKNGNWGIINSNNEIKTPFIYDKIIPLRSNTYETIEFDNNKIILEFKKQQLPKYYLAQKGFGWGIINENNEVLVPFEYKKNLDNNELQKVKSEINKKIDYDNDKKERLEARNTIPYMLLDMLLIPIWLILPYPFTFHADFDYF